MTNNALTATKIQILAPAGSFESLSAAINSGADAVYFGCGKLNMRSRAGSFAFSDMEKVVSECHNSKKYKTQISKNKNSKTLAFLTLNTIMYDGDISDIHNFCKEAQRVGVDAVICSDIAAIQIARSYNLRVHISTQQNISNVEAVKFFATFADTIVLARELTIEQIAKISEQIKAQNICGPSGNLIELEAFVHGALCVAIAGKCGMSLATYNSSANRGACFQVCRRAYTISDVETDSELTIDGKYVMSPKDLCTLGMIDKLIGAGVTLLKIEGRARGPEYVSTVVRAYADARDAFIEQKLTQELQQQLIDRVSTVFNRGFWQNGYYMGVSTGEWCTAGGSVAKTVKSLVGFVENYYPKAKVALIKLENCSLSQGSTLAFSGPTTGWLQIENAQLQIDETVNSQNSQQPQPSQPSQILQGSVVTVRVPDVVRKNDKVFTILNR